MKNEELDGLISSSLAKSELEIPVELQRTIRRRIVALANQPHRSRWILVKIWLPLLAAAILLLVVSLHLLFQPLPEAKKISQIRTEFSIPGKNIKIIWVQREDFQLPETNG